MMNRLRNSASPASTWLGGICCRPSALRVRPSTTRILVKLVQVSRIAGTSESRVSPSSARIGVLGFLVRSLICTVTSPSVDVPVPRGPVGPLGPFGVAVLVWPVGSVGSGAAGSTTAPTVPTLVVVVAAGTAVAGAATAWPGTASAISTPSSPATSQSEGRSRGSACRREVTRRPPGGCAWSRPTTPGARCRSRGPSRPAPTRGLPWRREARCGWPGRGRRRARRSERRGRCAGRRGGCRGARRQAARRPAARRARRQHVGERLGSAADAWDIAVPRVPGAGTAVRATRSVASTVSVPSVRSVTSVPSVPSGPSVPASSNGSSSVSSRTPPSLTRRRPGPASRPRRPRGTTAAQGLAAAHPHQRAVAAAEPAGAQARHGPEQAEDDAEGDHDADEFEHGSAGGGLGDDLGHAKGEVLVDARRPRRGRSAGR